MKNLHFILQLFLGLFFTINNCFACDSPANISINPNYIITNDTDCEIEYGNSGFLPTGNPNIPLFNYYCQLENLPQNNYLDFYVRKRCNGVYSAWVGPFTFYNFCREHMYNVNIEENFENSFLPYCWTEANAGSPTTGIEGIGNSNWEASTLPYNTTNHAAKIYYNGNTTNDWIIIPLLKSIGLLKGYNTLDVNFYLSLTQHNTTLSSDLGSDDKLQLCYSTDLGESWHIIQEWNQSTPISNTGNFYSYSMSIFSDYNLFDNPFLVAFWANSGSVIDSNNPDLYIDNLIVSAPYFGNSVDLNSDIKINISPNPSINSIKINSTKVMKRIKLFDLNGKLINSLSINTLEEIVDLNNLLSGLYMFKIETDNQISSKLIIKN